MSQTQQDRIEELARLLDGDVTDRSSSEAQQLLVLANAVRDNAPELERPTPAFRAQLRAQLVEEAAAAQVGVLDRVRDAVRERTARWRYSARVATASVTASMMIGSAGAAVAAQSALPGELLYPLKQATESARLALASSTEETGRVQLDLARERLAEITEGIDSLTPSQVIDTLAAMDRSSEAGAEHLLTAFDRTHEAGLLDELDAFTRDQRSGLTAIIDQLPLEAVPFADRSFELLRRIDIQSAISAGACDCGLSATIAGASSAAGRGIAAPGDGPAAPACDCEEGAATAPRDTGLLSDGLGIDADTSDETGTSGTSGGTGSSGSVGTLTDPVDDSLTEPVEELADTVDDVTDTVEDTVSEPIEDTTEPIEDVIDDITEPVGADTSGDGTDLGQDLVDTVDEVTDAVTDVLP